MAPALALALAPTLASSLLNARNSNSSSLFSSQLTPSNTGVPSLNSFFLPRSLFLQYSFRKGVPYQRNSAGLFCTCTSENGAFSTENDRGEIKTEEETPSQNSIDLNLPRRRLQIQFTCNVCLERTTRIINPHALAKGTIFVQCAGCQSFHQLVDNLGLIQEFDFRKENLEETMQEQLEE